MEETVGIEQGRSWSLGNRKSSFEKGPLMGCEASFSQGWHIINPADSRGLFGGKTQRNIKGGRLAEFIKGTQGTGSPLTTKENCLGLIWELLVVHVEGTLLYIFS